MIKKISLLLVALLLLGTLTVGFVGCADTEDRKQRFTLSPPYLRNQPCEWSQATRRNNKVTHRKASCRFARTFHNPGHRDVLCKKGHFNAQRNHQ